VKKKIRQTRSRRLKHPHLVNIPIPTKLLLVLKQEITRPSSHR
jgi:hypothetical protein